MLLRVHHLNCGTMNPLGGKYLDGFSKGAIAKLCCHCLVIETNNGLVLIDTGIGTLDIADPEGRLNPLLRSLNQIKLEEDQTILRQIEQLGFKRDDVRNIIQTHLDFDQAGGLSDFPNAQVHILEDELKAATRPRTIIERLRYSAAQWKERQNWNLYKPEGSNWYGFECVKNLKGLPKEIILVPLMGHTWGHAGVAIETDQGWLLHAGDAYFYRDEMSPYHYHCTPGLSLYQTFMEVHRPSRLWNQKKLRGLVQQNRHEVKVFSSHDALELDYFKKAEQKALLEKRHKKATLKAEAPPPQQPSSNL